MLVNLTPRVNFINVLHACFLPIFGAKISYKKVAHKMLVNLIPSVNFININRTNFLYKIHFGSFFSSYMFVVKAAETTFIQKIGT